MADDVSNKLHIELAVIDSEFPGEERLDLITELVLETAIQQGWKVEDLNDNGSELRVKGPPWKAHSPGANYGNKYGFTRRRLAGELATCVLGWTEKGDAETR